MAQPSIDDIAKVCGLLPLFFAQYLPYSFVSQAFVQHYYTLFDGDRKQLVNLYVCVPPACTTRSCAQLTLLAARSINADFREREVSRKAEHFGKAHRMSFCLACSRYPNPIFHRTLPSNLLSTCLPQSTHSPRQEMESSFLCVAI